MVRKSFSLSIGLPHSGHSGGVSGSVSSSIVLSTSTNGTSATMPANNSPARLATAPISMPPALPPWPTMRFALVYFASISARPAAAKSSKRVRLLLALAVEIPAPALVVAASDMGDGIDKAAVDQRQPIGGKGRRHRHAVGAVAVEQQRRPAVAHQILAVQDRDRHLRAVMRRRHDARGDVVGRVVAGRDLLALAQDARARRHVVVVDFRRRRHRRIGEAQIGGVEFVAAHGVERIGRLVEGDGVLLAGLEVADDDRGQRIGALQPHHVAGIEFDIEHIDALAIRDQVAPVGALGRGQRRGDDLEVDGAIGIGENEQLVAAVGERILHALFARRDEARRRIGIGQIDQPLLRGLMVAAGDDAEAAAGAFMQMGEPAGILLFINERIVGLLRSEAMPPHLHWPVVVVELDVEEAFAVRAPDDPAVGLLDEIVKIRAIGPVAHPDREIFRSLGIGAPGLEPVVQRMPRAAELEIFVVLGQLVAVEHDLDSPPSRGMRPNISCCPPSRNFRK